MRDYTRGSRQPPRHTSRAAHSRHVSAPSITPARRPHDRHGRSHAVRRRREAPGVGVGACLDTSNPHPSAKRSDAVEMYRSGSGRTGAIPLDGLFCKL